MHVPTFLAVALSLICYSHLGAVELVDSLSLGVENPISISISDPPDGLVADAELGLLRHESLTGQVVHSAKPGVRGLFETRAVRTPKGDLLLMFPEGDHYAAGSGKVNDFIAYRSKDNGKTWRGPNIAFDINYSQHGFIPLIPKGSKRIYAFGTQPIPSAYSREKGKHENTPIGFRWSDDDGYTWSDATLIKPENDPGFLGMSVTRMCETDRGSWILGSHAADWSRNPLTTQQYLLRSTDKGETWTLLPNKRPNGWFSSEFKRMDEGRPIALGNGEVFFMGRTPTGRIWTSRSFNDGATWRDPKPSELVHPDAPPMVYHLSDKKTLITFIHNRHMGTEYEGLTGKMDGMKDRSEIWIALSKDGGRGWSEPQFLLANASVPDPKKNGWFNHQVSYLDAVIDDGAIHLFCPHLWNRAVYLQIQESALAALPTAAQFTATTASPQDFNQDWTGWLGPERNARVAGAAFPANWNGELEQVWKVEVGTGHGTPIVVGEHVWQHARPNGSEVVTCLKLATGKQVWQEGKPVAFKIGGGGELHGKGPKSSPVYADGRIFTKSITGVLTARDAMTGKLLWQKDYRRQFRPNQPYWGVSVSPLVDGDQVVTYLGNDKEGSLFAFDAATGDFVWRLGEDATAYSSPIVVEIEGVRQIVHWNREDLIGVESQTGKLLWKFHWPYRGNNQNTATPTYHNGFVIVGGEGRGIKSIEPKRVGDRWIVSESWHQKEVSLDTSSTIQHEGRLYGISEYKRGQFFCLDPKRGKVLWLTQGREGDHASFLSVGDRLLALTTGGMLKVLKGNSEAYDEEREVEVADGSTWAPPVFLRDGLLIKTENELIRWRFSN
ncbi:PQQ-binding-like beta-propeller repeat protein [Verrucomicrobiales bacterium]|jgi:outer membrane protein assembly factor BamB|nr:PQQ-binding-like beta-propeller repeat protein [Verrucomicrobiales bacterium]